MTRFKGAFIKEQNITFAIIIVDAAVFSGPSRERSRRTYSMAFGGVPTILLTIDTEGRFLYHGREDIVNFLASLSPDQIPWKEFKVF